MIRISNLEENLIKEKRLLTLITALVISYIIAWLPYHATKIYIFFTPAKKWFCSKWIFSKISMTPFLPPSGFL